MNNVAQRTSKIPLPILLFLCARIPLLLALPFDGLRGYGDLLHFFNVAMIPGLPYIDYWIEYPPGFAFLNEVIYALAGGVEHVFTYLMVTVLFAADIGNIHLFLRLEKQIAPGGESPSWRSLVYAAILAGLPYAWWYYDPLAVFFTLLTLHIVLRRGSSSLAVGAALGAGILTKLFPVLLLPALARTQPPRRTAVITATALGLFALPLIILYPISPAFTRAALSAQTARGSLQTVWALIDNNYRTGGYGPLVERLDPAMASVMTRNPPVISPYLLLVIFGGLGLFLWWRARLDTPAKIVAFAGLTMVIFFIWSPAWSPQWIQHLLPLALLTLPFSPGLLLMALLVLVNLLEWPLLLSRGLFYTFPLTILLRLFLMIVLGWLFYQGVSEAVPGQRETAG